jgi:hypothetical protein
MGNSGAYGLAQSRNRQASQNAYAGGLADIQNDYWTQQREGAQALGQIGSQYGQTAAQQAESGINEGLGLGKLGIEQQNANTANRNSLTDLFTAYGTVGGALGGTGGYAGQTATGFNNFKQYLFSLLGLPY